MLETEKPGERDPEPEPDPSVADRGPEAVAAAGAATEAVAGTDAVARVATMEMDC